MKGIAACTCVLALFATATLAQDESESTTVTTTTSGGADLLGDLWNMDDATILPTGSLDWRTTIGWGTGGEVGDSSDDFTYSGSLLWGMAENIEGFLITDWVIGEGEVDHNGDLTLGLNWRFSEPDGDWPAMSLKGSATLPSGHQSSGVDAEGRLILTNEYDSGMRSHVNLFLVTDNGDENGNAELRNVNYGAVFGLDGPLCDNGNVRWVADYMWRAGRETGSANYNVLELGWEWQKDASSKVGMSVQINLDRASNESDFGASFTYSQALTF